MGVDPSTVTEKVLEETEEGVEGWATYGQDARARGPMGNAMYRQMKKPSGAAAAETYKWLSEDLKKKFRQTWAMKRSWDFIDKKRIRSVESKTKQEVGTWKNQLQLEVHFGGAGLPEAVRQANNYIINCKTFEDVFVRFNTWTDAENYLLVEKLVSKIEVEAFKEVAEMVDGSGTFQTESFRMKAMRKFAVYHNLQLEEVNYDDVANSPQGLRGWGEMNIAVPGIAGEGGGHASPVEPAPTLPPVDPEGGEAGGLTIPNKQQPKGRGKGGPRKRGADNKDAPAPKRKVKKELTAEQSAEASSKQILTHLQWSQQIMQKVAGDGDDIPSEYRWAKSFLEDYRDCLSRFKDAVAPCGDGGDDLIEFVDELKLCVISKGGMKTLKKGYGDRYVSMLSLFVDRCQKIAAEKLGMDSISNKVHKMSQVLVGAPKPAKRGMTGCEVATLSHFITRAGGVGLEDLALPPSTASKNGHAHVRSKAGKIYPEVDLDYVTCPMFVKRDACRSSESIPIFLPSKAFQTFLTTEMLENHPKKDVARVLGGLDSYDAHPVVEAAKHEGFKNLVRPVALYWDGVAYTKNDSFFAFYVTDILSSEEMCQCGCRGWCTLFPLLHKWTCDLKSLQTGDTRFAVLDIQGDWPAFLQVFGLRYWSHKTHPCPLRTINQEELGRLRLGEMTVDSMPYPFYTTNDVRADLANVLEVTSTQMRSKILQSLAYKKKWRGRALISALPQYGLGKGSRLMPTPSMPDVAKFEFMEVPFTVWWWVGPEDFRLVHDCPLVELDGVGLESFSLDIMHSWHLGPLQLLVSLVLNFCLDCGRVSKVDDFFDASQCLEIVEKTVEEFDSDPSNTRALDSLDLFAGKGNFCAECQAGGKTSMTVDILHDKKNHDILTRTGFFYVLQCILTMDTLVVEQITKTLTYLESTIAVLD
ncbi:Uncharacterized protein SCF082_LOCUS28143 [Durusdinium trenchii]|uniref:DNA-directed DNA polymerase n=1 Tax=Durusdinium trenchii TaxID=1381693 RepID=A0ABP0MIB8_9DINO